MRFRGPAFRAEFAAVAAESGAVLPTHVAGSEHNSPISSI